MRISARPAETDDIHQVMAMYRGLEEEMTGLHPMWPLADGLAEPVVDSLAALIADAGVEFVIGEIDGIPVGFLVARAEALLAQASGDRVGVIRYIFVEHQAREVGVAEAMRDRVMDTFRSEGITKFDAHVLPGHRLAKNFFEAGGFSARSIVMHHDDNR